MTPADAHDEPLSDPFARRLAAQLDRMAERAGPSEAGTDGAPVPDQALGAGTGDDGADRLTAAIAQQLREPSTWTGPPPSLRAAVLARALAAGDPGDAAATAPPATGSPLRSVPRPSAVLGQPAAPQPPVGQPAAPSALPSRWRRLTWAVPLAAAAAVVFTFGVVAVDRAIQDDTGPGRTYAAAGTPLARQAGAEVTVSEAAGGYSVVLAAHDLPPAAPGFYYAAWLNNGKVSVPLGSFHARQSGAPIKLWSGVDPRDYPRFTVTLQTEGQTPLPSTQRYLIASLTG